MLADAVAISPGDCVCVYGQVGAGKSVFARALVRRLLKDDAAVVTSPTYLLQNTYETEEGVKIKHFDLYRLQDETSVRRVFSRREDGEEGGLFALDAVSIFEWPERLGSLQPESRLDVYIATNEEKDNFDVVEIGDTRDAHLLELDEEYEEDERVTTTRTVAFKPNGESWTKRIARFHSNLLL